MANLPADGGCDPAGADNMNDAPATATGLNGVYLFVSVDMVNSTEFKDRERHWPLVLHHFYESVVKEMKQVCPRFKIWKYIGDEVTFWRHTTKDDDLADLIRQTHEALQSICRTLDDIETAHRIRTRHVVGAKATMWAATAHFVRNAGIERDLVANYLDDNRIILVEEEHGLSLAGEDGERLMKTFDFIGPDIDIGFRIAHFVRRGFVALSAGLAYLVLSQAGQFDDIEKQIKIVGYEKMKGVWGGRRYPIIWYTDDWMHVREKFYYDERLEDPVVAEICREHYEDCTKIARILSQANRWDMVVRGCTLLGLPVESPPDYRPHRRLRQLG